MAQSDIPQENASNQLDHAIDASVDRTHPSEDHLLVKEGTLFKQHEIYKTAHAYGAFDANAIAQERCKSPDTLKGRQETPESESRARDAELPERAAYSSPRDNGDGVQKLLTEHDRQQRLVDNLKQNSWLEKDKWETLSATERRVALEYAGRSLRDAYECPDPSLIPKDFPEYDGKTLLGQYRDADYDIQLSEQLLAGKDAEEALKTYCHEFRHAYQHEMVQRYDSGTFRHLVHDKEVTAQWSQNFNENGYCRPDADFEKYWQQPVEVDARQFSERTVKALYGTKRT